jgi:phosphoglycolate phosphatase
MLLAAMIRFNRRFDPHNLKLVIFDLDGTLIDSRLDLIHSVNAALRHVGRRDLPGDLIATYVGDGAPMLVRRALGEKTDDDMVHRALAYFLSYYREHKLDYTHTYPGVMEMLAAVQAAGDGQPRRMAVLSNKPVRPSQAIVDELGLGRYFVAVYGGNSFPTKKPHPLGAEKILEETGSRPEESLIVGDSAHDVLTGRAAGLWTCGVTYGFAPHSLEDAPPDVMVDSAAELGDLFSSQWV